MLKLYKIGLTSFAIFLLILSLITNAQNNDTLISKVDWVNGFQGIAEEIATDISGNSYAVGIFKESINIETEELVSNGVYDIFLIKYDFDGNLVWAKSFGENGSDFVKDICLDKNGDIYITGSISVDATIIDAGNVEMFLAKYDKDGNKVWFKKSGGRFDDVGNSVCLDKKGNIFVTGKFSSYALFDSVMVTGAAQNNFFIAKYDPNGSLLWVQKASSDYSVYSGSSFGLGVATDNKGNCFVTGYYNDVAFFENIELNSSGGSDFFIVKYDSSGQLLWANDGGGGTADVGTSVAIDDNGNCYATGYLNNSAIFDNIPLLHFGSFVAKYNSTGTIIWAKKINEFAHGQDILITKDNLLQLTGYGDGNYFSSLYDLDGDLVEAQKTNSGHVNGKGISTDSNGNIYICGGLYFGETTIFDNYSLNGSNFDSFLLKLSSNITSISVDESKSLLFSIYQNYPNPFNPTTKIRYYISRRSQVKVEVFNSIGQKISTLINRVINPGQHEIFFNADNLASGVYYYRIYINELSIKKKMLLIR